MTTLLSIWNWLVTHSAAALLVAGFVFAFFAGRVYSRITFVPLLAVAALLVNAGLLNYRLEFSYYVAAMIAILLVGFCFGSGKRLPIPSLPRRSSRGPSDA